MANHWKGRTCNTVAHPEEKTMKRKHLFDEFFFRTVNEDGSRTVPGEYINTDYAQSFLHFGTDPDQAGDVRSSGTFYEEEIDGETALRIIYNPYQIHPWNHVSTKVAAQGIEYFEKTLGAPNPIPAKNQIWTIKFFFNFIGLIGLVMFIVGFTKAMLYTGTFASLRASEEVSPQPALDSRGKWWFWGTSIVVSIIAYLSYLNLYNWTVAHRPAFFPQRPTYYIGMWSAVMGLTVLLVLFVTYKLYSKQAGMDLRASGLAMSLKSVLKTIALALVVVATTFGIVFVADYFFKVDFRAWVLTVRTFTPDKIAIALKYAPLFLLYYVASSMAVNSFNHFKLLDREWLNTAVVAGFTALGPAIIVAVQYITFFSTGEVFYSSVSNIIGIWLFPVVVILPTAAVVSRKIFRASRNPYLPGLIMGLIVTLMIASNTLTEL